MPPFDYKPQPYSGPFLDEILQKRKQYLCPSMFYFYEKPLNIVEGKMQYLFDESGRRYLDAFGGIVTVSCGHCHPDIVDTIVKQTRLLQHTTTIYLHHAITEFAEALAAKFPGNLKVVFFTNSGTESNELTTMMARLYNGNHDMISLRNSYNGSSANTMGMTAQSKWKYNVVQTRAHHALNPNPYRGPFGSDGAKYAKDVQDIIDFGTSGRVAGFMAEPIQGVGGAVEMAPGYLKPVYESGVIPDIVKMAKGIGNGLPLGAVVTNPEIAQVLTQRCHFNTFGGNPVCAAGGHAVLKVLDKEKRQEHCAVVGPYLINRLRELQEKYEVIGDKLQLYFEKLKDMGVLAGKGRMYGNVFRIKPPMCFTKEDSDFLVDVMDHALSQL
ncbi:hypothetical protein SUGI_1193400 [Cryptomeria japonica]|nr:hypothetical protein SUGI_1193400 [Cryptomeria japonica]